MLEIYESIWNKIRNIIEEIFDKNLIHHGQYLSTKLKYCNYRTANFYDKKTTQIKISFFYLATIVLESLCKIKDKGNKYYPLFYLEECIYEEKKLRRDT